MSISENVYNRIWTLLDGASLSYFKTTQKAFFPRAENLVSPNLYPWLFTEFISESRIGIFQMPRHWQWELTFGVVALTISSTALNVDDLIYSNNANVKGIGDIKDDLKAVFHGTYKIRDFGVSGVFDWTIGRVGIPTVPMVQRLLQSEYVKGVQVDLVFRITEQDTL